MYLFLGDRELNTMLIVLPQLLVPNCEYSHRLFKELPGAMILGGLFGQQFFEFCKLLSFPLTSPIRKMRKEGPVELIDVGFHPLIGIPNWAPWPTIQLVKCGVMEKAEQWYESRANFPISKITFDNFQRSQQLNTSASEQQKWNSDRLECYKI